MITRYKGTFIRPTVRLSDDLGGRNGWFTYSPGRALIRGEGLRELGTRGAKALMTVQGQDTMKTMIKKVPYGWAKKKERYLRLLGVVPHKLT